MAQVCVVIADGCVDIIQEDCPELREHIRDLRDMGCTVRVKKFTNWVDAHALEEKING